MFLMTLTKMTSWAVSIFFIEFYSLMLLLLLVRVRRNLLPCVFVNVELDALEADMGNETEADGVPSYLQPDTEPDLDEGLDLPPPPTGRTQTTGAQPGRAQAEDEWGLPAVPRASLRG